MNEIEIFFNRSKEIEENIKFAGSNSSYDSAELQEYVYTLLKIPYKSFLDHVRTNEYDICLLSSDVPQFSSIESATSKICTILKLQRIDQGYSFTELGKLLLDGKTRSEYALKKYGENHVKTAVDLGLCRKEGNKYYLSALGYLYADLSEECKHKLLSRLALRHKLVFRVIHKILNNQFVYITDEIAFLAKSTIERRRGNCLLLCKLISLNQEIDTTGIIEKIN
jgi:hypothetical protein